MAERSKHLLLVDDNALSRAGFVATLMRATTDFERVEAFDDAGGILAAVSGCKSPVIVVINYQLRHGASRSLIKEIVHACRHARVLVVGMLTDQSSVVAALQIGVYGLLSKSDAEKYLVDALELLANGNAYLSPEICNTVVGLFALPDLGRLLTDINLTGRETDVLRFVSQGETNRLIAARMNLTVKAVQNTRSRLAKKLHSQSTAELIRHAVDRGLVSSPVAAHHCSSDVLLRHDVLSS